jgi:hypothetical protein
MKRLVSLIFLSLMWALPVGAQVPPAAGLVVGQTPVQAGTSGDCLTVGSNGRLSQAVCTSGSVTTWSGGTTGLLPSSATSGAITVTGTLVGGNGGTGIASYAVGDMLYASGATTLSKLADIATGNVLLSGGVAVAPSWGKVDLAAAITGVLLGANGGTGVANTGKTITLGGNLTTSGAFASTFTMSNTTSVTFPTSGTLATLAGSEALTNKSYNGNTWTAGTGTLTLAASSTLATSGANSITLTSTGSTNVTLPTSGTLATVGGALGVFTGTSLALGGCTIGSNALCTTGTSTFGGNVIVGSGSVVIGAAGTSLIVQPGSGGLFQINNNGGGLGAFFNGGALSLPNAAAGGGIYFSSTTSPSGAIDVMMTRNSAGVMEVNSGTVGTLRDMTLRNLTASTTIIFSGLGSDATHTDSSVCVDASNGTLYKGSGAAGICLGTSSARYKHDISDDPAGLAELAALKPVTYRYNRGYGTGSLLHGFLAEDVAEVLPGLVGLDAEGRPNTLDMMGLMPIMVNAIQELKAQVDQLKASK